VTAVALPIDWTEFKTSRSPKSPRGERPRTTWRPVAREKTAMPSCISTYAYAAPSALMWCETWPRQHNPPPPHVEGDVPEALVGCGGGEGDVNPRAEELHFVEVHPHDEQRAALRGGGGEAHEQDERCADLVEVRLHDRALNSFVNVSLGRVADEDARLVVS
jgi:hypothetical protein